MEKSTIVELLTDLYKLESQFEEAKLAKRTAIISEMQQMIRALNISARELGLGRYPGGRLPNPPKYRNPATGATWSGRGREPNWILGKDRSAYEIEAFDDGEHGTSA
ncbi:H-NS family nucleoid-associated regulatory protein [Burkholderia pyrrocinia]|uniref:H-NS histone family protein n=1 Tax=Burkholderia pyrrocinia TaxID=60550 RepID=UPI00158DCECD|nr:H-NS histone family protein [Burkholderia pyrrocinia]